MAFSEAAVQRRARRVGLLVALAVLALAAPAVASAATGTITIATQVTPATDGGRFDVALDGATIGTALAGGSALGPLVVEAGSHTVAAQASTGTTTIYTSTVTCTDGTMTLADGVGAGPIAVDVPEGTAVVCTFTHAAAPATSPIPTTAPPTPVGAPILLPPVMVRGLANLRGPEGCTTATIVRSRVVAVNAVLMRFYRDGRLVSTIRNGELERLAVTLPTRLAPEDRRLHQVRVHVRFVTGAQPAAVNLVHRFQHCGASAVTG